MLYLPILRHVSFPLDRTIKIICTTKIQEQIDFLSQKYQTPIFTPQEVRRLSNRLIKSHTPRVDDVLKKYSITQNKIMNGIHCPNCFEMSIQKFRCSWYCRKCNHLSKDAHLASLRDYVLLFGPYITNRKLRNFFQIASPSVSMNILLSLNLPYSGSTRDRVYILPIEEV